MATPSYKELTAQIEALTQEAEAARIAELEAVVSQIKQLMGDFGITAGDLGFKVPGAGRKKTANAAAAKYRDPESGATWTGRGRAPAWIAGKDRSKYAV